MEKVLNQAELLAEAILESEEYINMRLTEQAVMKDEEATLLVANYSEKRSKVEELLANPNMDRGELAKAGQELQEAEHMLDHNKLIAKMQETNDAFTDMMKKVNKIIKKVVTGEEEEEEHSGCSGSCWMRSWNKKFAEDRLFRSSAFYVSSYLSNAGFVR